MMFGPNDSDSTHSEMSIRWKIKRFSNDELRQRFVDMTIPQADLLGLTVPDPMLKYNEAKKAMTLDPSTGMSFGTLSKAMAPAMKKD